MPGGSCLCGAVQYQTRTPLAGIDHCHCSMCRRSHGTAFSTYGRVDREELEITRGSDALEHYTSSDVVKRSFCRHCGSSLFFDHSAAPQFMFIAVGTLDDDPGARPEAHIFVASKAPWFEIEDDLPQYEAYPPGVAGEESPS